MTHHPLILISPGRDTALSFDGERTESAYGYHLFFQEGDICGLSDDLVIKWFATFGTIILTGINVCPAGRAAYKFGIIIIADNQSATIGTTVHLVYYRITALFTFIHILTPKVTDNSL